MVDLGENFAPGSFDVVIESLVFHHVSDDLKRTTISEIYKALAPAGLFYFIDWIQPKGLYAKLSFNIVKILDGNINTQGHETNKVLLMIEEKFTSEGTSVTIQTTVGTIGLIVYQKKALKG